jgi:hypothetical protein
MKRIENIAILFFGDVESPKYPTHLFLDKFPNPPMRCNYSLQTTSWPVGGETIRKVHRLP